MTDYLELLLERREEEEEEQDVLRLGGEETFPGKRAAAGDGAAPAADGGDADAPPVAEEWQPEGLGAQQLQEGPAAQQAQDGPVTEQMRDGPGAKWMRDDPGTEWMQAGQGTRWVRADRKTGQGAETAAEAGTQRPMERFSPMLPAAGKAFSAAGAAALERRLAEQSLAASAPPARTVFVREADGAGPAAGWDEFDRRVERDARRYDGGVGLY